MLFACTKRTKSTPEVCEPLDSGDDSKLCRKRFCRNFRRLVSKPVLPTKRRRKGFESVRKGDCTANARLIFFEKELLYSKLTATSDIRKGLLHVSLGVVRSRCRCALKKFFLYRIALYEQKTPAFLQTKSISFAQSFSYSHPKQFFSTLHLPFAPPLTYCLQRIQPFF